MEEVMELTAAVQPYSYRVLLLLQQSFVLQLSYE